MVMSVGLTIQNTKAATSVAATRHGCVLPGHEVGWLSDS